jgi:hypothetical protein
MSELIFKHIPVAELPESFRAELAKPGGAR